MALNFANNNSLSAISVKPSGLSGGSMNLISTQTASSSSTISFTSGIDSTYDEYVFKFINIHASNNSAAFQVNFSVDSGSNYNATKTTTAFNAQHKEDGSGGSLGYESSFDLAQSTSPQPIILGIGNLADENGNATMSIFSPSSTTFVKHFISIAQANYSSEWSFNSYVAGYINSTSAVDAVQFSMSAGTIDSGVIKLYGIS